MDPKMIIVYGSSGSGKTSLAKALQEALLPSIWLHFSDDTITYSLPPSVLNQCNLKNDWSGVDWDAVCQGTFSCLRALVDGGNRVVFDAVLSSQKQVDFLERHCGGINRVATALKCDWEEIERRTLKRGDRTLEEVKSSFGNVLHHIPNDFVYDTTCTEAQEIASDFQARTQSLVTLAKHHRPNKTGKPTSLRNPEADL